MESNDIPNNNSADSLSLSLSQSQSTIATETTSSDLSLLEMYNEKIPFDMTIEIGQRKFSTHKHILILYSDYFRTLFESDFDENINSTLVLNDDINSDTFAILLKYIYSGKIDLSHVVADNNKIELLMVDLFKLADRFLIEKLKQKCLTELLANYVTEETVFSYLLLFNTYDGCEPLKEKCCSLFHKHPYLLKTEQFSKLESSLAMMIYKTFF